MSSEKPSHYMAVEATGVLCGIAGSGVGYGIGKAAVATPKAMLIGGAAGAGAGCVLGCGTALLVAYMVERGFFSSTLGTEKAADLIINSEYGAINPDVGSMASSLRN